MNLKNRALGFGLLTCVGLLAPLGVHSRRSQKTPVATVRTTLEFMNCHDGDTCKARNPEGLVLTLRLLGIDAPEVAGRARRGQKKPAQRFGNEARDYLVGRVVGKKLPVEIKGNDIYQRYLAVIYDEKGTHRINEDLVREGYAYAYRASRSDPEARAWAERAETEAQKKKVGFWALPASERPVDPSLYRKKNR